MTVTDTAYAAYRQRIHRARTGGMHRLEAARDLLDQRRTEIDEALAARDAAVIEALLAGITAADVAAAADLSVQRIYALRAAHYDQQQQP